jgi:hypothetical protein
MRLSTFKPLPALFLLGLISCGKLEPDKPSERPANVLGSGIRIRDVTNPDKKPANNTNVNVSGAVVVHVDTFDETGDGKSRGGIFIQDLNSKEPYSGIGLFAPAFIPAELRVSPGDVLDFNGPYQENASIGAARFPGVADGQAVQNVLVQLARPTGTFRFDGPPPEPTEIDVNDLVKYEVGRKWYGMLVTVKNVTVQSIFRDRSNRLTGCIAGDCPNNRSNPPVISNEFTDLAEQDLEGKTFKSVTGVVTYFYSLKIAPRSRADLVE